jgi:hypothetical protein
VHFGVNLGPSRVAHPPNSIRVNWSTFDLSTSPTAGQICITAPAVGRVCASYAAGERPADALTRQLEASGVVVQNG